MEVGAHAGTAEKFKIWGSKSHNLSTHQLCDLIYALHLSGPLPEKVVILKHEKSSGTVGTIVDAQKWSIQHNYKEEGISDPCSVPPLVSYQTWESSNPRCLSFLILKAGNDSAYLWDVERIKWEHPGKQLSTMPRTLQLINRWYLLLFVAVAVFINHWIWISSTFD